MKKKLEIKGKRRRLHLFSLASRRRTCYDDCVSKDASLSETMQALPFSFLFTGSCRPPKGGNLLKYYQSDAEMLREYEGERLTKAEERGKSNSRRLDRLERLTDEVSKQNEHIARLVLQLQFTNEQLKAHDQRLQEIENRPHQNTRAVIGAILTAVFSAIAGAAVTLLF